MLLRGTHKMNPDLHQDHLSALSTGQIQHLLHYLKIETSFEKPLYHKIVGWKIHCFEHRHTKKTSCF